MENLRLESVVAALNFSNQRRREALHNWVKLFGSPGHWREEFQKQLDRFLSRAQMHMDDLKKLQVRSRSTDRKKESEIARHFARANKLARLSITHDHNNYPLNTLSANGFLPNFDFPGKVVRFVGVLSSYQDKTKSFVHKNDRYLSYTRSASIALREFAPEQKIYGQGFIYKVDRYVSEGSDANDGRAWGICLAGCAELTPPASKTCRFCEGDLIRSGEGKASQPKLMEVQEVLGMQVAVISDQQNKREFNPIVREVRHLGLPKTEKMYHLRGVLGFGWSLYQDLDEHIQIVTFLKGRGRETDEGLRIDPLYREVGDGENRMFNVKARRPSEDETGWEPFIPAVFCKSQGLRVSLPYFEAKNRGWISDLGEDERAINVYFKTFSALLERAAVRVLRLNRRKGAVSNIDDDIRCPTTDGRTTLKERNLLILDNEEGGSGIIELIWVYWDALMQEAGRLALQKCCTKACYRCLKSYDNQQDHDLFDKTVFVVINEKGSHTPLFLAFRRMHEGAVNEVKADAGQLG